MKITGTSVNNVINIYDKHKNHVQNNRELQTKKDYIEISELGKSLSAYSGEDKIGASNDKIEKLRAEVAKGTYKVDAKLVAEKIIDVMKGRKV